MMEMQIVHHIAATFAIGLVSCTPNAETTVLRVARVTSPNPSSEDTKLIGYLIRNGHWSPFEHAHMTMSIQTSRAIAAQLLRHRSFTFQEFSQRYGSPGKPIIYNGRRQATVNRQSSVDDLPDEVQSWWHRMQVENANNCQRLYVEALEMGIAKECARFVLPLSTETHVYMTGSLRSWIHYFELRCSEDTQLEHREIAEAIRSMFEHQFPIISRALWASEVPAEDAAL